MSQSKKCSINKLWFEKIDSGGFKIGEWARLCEKTTNILCIVCACTINCDNKGFQSLTQHASTKKHKSQCIDKLGSKQLHLYGSLAKQTNTDAIENSVTEKNTKTSLHTLGIKMYCKNEQAIKAEIIWTIKSVICNMSATSCDGLSEIFKCMFPDSFPDQFSLGRSKMSYLISDALGPYFKSIVIDDIHGSYYTMLYDETTNTEGKKELQVAIRYWSKNKNEIIVIHLESFFITSATAEKIIEYLIIALDNADLPKEKLLMLGSDGPNVNKKVSRIINSNIKSLRGKGLVEIGSCNIHTVHNAFVKGLEHIGSDISDLVISIYYFFKDWPKRLEDFTDVQIKQNLPKHRFIKHCESRWLTLGPAAERLVEQWDGIIYYFEKFIPQHRSELMKTPKYLRIHKVLNEPTVKAEIIFIINSAKIFQKFTLIFQRQEPLIHVLHSELRNLIIVIAGKICKAEVLKTWNNNTSLFDNDNLKPLDLIEIPIQASTILSLVSERCKLLFLKSVQAHYISAGKHILNKTSFLHATKIKYFRCLLPTELQVERSCSEIVKISTYLPFEVDPGVLADEWRLLRCESKLQAKIFKNGLGGEMRIDHYWNQFIQIQDSFGNIKYPNICKVVTASLTLSHGSADVERQFSVSGNVLTDDKTAMSCRMLNARLNIKSGLQFYQNRPDLVPISKKLMVSAQMARQNYMAYLDKKKKLEQETNQLRQQRENEEIQKQKDLAEVEKTKKSIQHLEGQLKSAVNVQINQKKASDQLLNDGNKRLKKALNKNDAVEAKIAQSMIEAATKLRNEERENELETSNIHKQIEKRKNCLITNFIKKQKTDKND